METTIYRGNGRAKSFPAPVTVGLRVGYIYRVEVAHLPNLPGVSLYPSIEVIGTLCLPPRISACNYPAPVMLTNEDIAVALGGGMVTKVVYLEHPDKAIPSQSTLDSPFETLLPATANALNEAREIGRPVLVVRLGGRQFTAEEMAHQAIIGTVLLPGESSLPLPRCPPVLPPVTWQWYDPTLGPRHPEEETIHNGGLSPNRGIGNPRVMDPAVLPGIDNEGRLHGLRSEDAVAEYTNSAGQRRVVCSNRVCLVVPRFGVLRQETPLIEYAKVTGPLGQTGICAYDLLRSRQPPRIATVPEYLQGLQGRQRPSGQTGNIALIRLARFEALEGTLINLGPGEALAANGVLLLTEIERTRLIRQVEFARIMTQQLHLAGFEGVQFPAVVARVLPGPELIQATAETGEVTCLCLKEPPQAPDKPLVLCKWADREAAKVGDVVTFFLRYSSHGPRPLTDVAVVDSLSPRLEYVPGSAQSNRPAVFTIQENEVGSQILRWDISGKLHPGERGCVRFQARVR
jgi:uncharacterized repeat protein (TIGR01451 family)